MPRKEIDYSNTVIYKITCNDDSIKEIYVGHTTNFVQRKHTHKQSCIDSKSGNYNLKLYKTIREHGGWENWNMEVVVYLNCSNSYEAKKKEMEYYGLLHSTLNSIQPLPKVIPSVPVENKIIKQLGDKDIFTESTDIKVACENTQVPNFVCKPCNFVCNKICHWKRHIDTKKHTSLSEKHNVFTDSSTSNLGNNIKYKCSKCNKNYKSSPGLWYHKKKCNPEIQNHTTIEIPKNKNVEEPSLAEMFVELMKQNKELQNQLFEMVKEKSVVTNNTNNTINNNTMNNKFNLQIFLNETCKDAMNIQEFIDFCKVQHSDFENFGKYGYVESMTRIIMRNLMELEVHRRPIHCTDVKREVLYVKDNNVWVNDFSREKLIRAIKYIAAKNVKQIPGWMDHNPDSKNTQTKLHDKYMRMVCHSMGGRDEAEDQEYYKKIIHNVAKEVVIDKMK